MVKKLSLLALVLLALGIFVPDSLALREKKTSVATGPLDDGKLDPSWFGPGVAFVETEEIDYFWARDGFSLDGESFHFAEWEEPHFLGEDAGKRDENDHRLARQLTADMPESFSSVFGRSFGNRASTSTEEGKIRVVGRIVDCSTGSVVAKALVGFGAGAGGTTIDVKFIEKSSGEVVAALHHRVVSGTNWSTTDSKFFKWLKKAADEIEKDDFGGTYKRGKPVKE